MTDERLRASLGGVPIVVHPGLPMYPSFNEDIRRQVRHGMADILEWCGIPVGPAPGEPIGLYMGFDGTRDGQMILFASREAAEKIKAEYR